MTNYAALLEFMGIDRLEHADSVRVRIDSSTDIGCFLRDQRPKVPHDMPLRVGRTKLPETHSCLFDETYWRVITPPVMMPPIKY